MNKDSQMIGLKGIIALRRKAKSIKRLNRQRKAVIALYDKEIAQTEQSLSVDYADWLANTYQIFSGDTLEVDTRLLEAIPLLRSHDLLGLLPAHSLASVCASQRFQTTGEMWVCLSVNLFKKRNEGLEDAGVFNYAILLEDYLTVRDAQSKG